MGNQINTNELYSLILQAIEGRISEEDFVKLENYLEQSDSARQIYSEMTLIYAYMRRPSLAFNAQAESSKETSSFDEMFWQQLAEYEKIAPKVEIPRHQSQSESLAGVIHPPREKRKLSKFGIFTLVNAAAMILFIVVLNLIPSKAGVEVATLIDSSNAHWLTEGPFTKNGGRLETGIDWLMLGDGLIEFKFDNNATVVMEGPAKFQILAEDRIGLDYGSIYTTVPKEAIGFSVYTRNAKIIDMGTEFGVQADLNGNTQLHVVKGRTTLMAGEDSDKVNIDVEAGHAKEISVIDSVVSDIECDRTKFVRKISVGSSNYVWHGENAGLASIVAGYDGFRKVSSLKAVNPATGQYTTSVVMDARASKKAYNRVPENSLIDGVFVPDGGSGPIPVTSAGHTFDCPNTKGLFTHEISAYKGAIDNKHTTIPEIVSGGIVYDKEPVVMLHSNIGITFDLQALYNSLPELDVTSFNARGTLTEAIGNSEDVLPDIDFWVLVDGKIKYEKKAIKIEDGIIDCNVGLDRHDRFLTLIVTDGLDSDDGKRVFPYGNDFFYLINPEFKLADRTE